MIIFQVKTPCFKVITLVSKLTPLVSKVTVFPNYFCFQLNFVSKLSFQVNYYLHLRYGWSCYFKLTWSMPNQWTEWVRLWIISHLIIEIQLKINSEIHKKTISKRLFARRDLHVGYSSRPDEERHLVVWEEFLQR